MMNLLSDPGFEQNGKGWCMENSCIVSDAHTGTKAVMTTKEGQAWFDLKICPTQALREQGNGLYRFSCFAKLKDTAPGRVRIAVKMIFEKDEYPLYITGGVAVPDTEAFCKMSYVFYVSTQDLAHLEIYFIGEGNGKASLIVDDAALEKIEEERPPLCGLNILRPQKMRVGAIRWDAYYACGDNPKSVANQVSRTLSYYPAQAPYYARPYAEKDRILTFGSEFADKGTAYTIDDVTSLTLQPQTVPYAYGVSWEEETALMLDAGIDYCAYVWYEDHNPMALPRKAHVANNGRVPDGRQMQLCWILEHGRIGAMKNIDALASDEEKIQAMPTDRKQMYQGMALECYLTVEAKQGRYALFYCMSAPEFSSAETAMLEKEARWYTAWLEKQDPARYRHIDGVYCIGIDYGLMNSYKAYAYAKKGMRAVSRYATDLGFAGGREETMVRYENYDTDCKNGKTITVRSNAYAELMGQDDRMNASYLPYAESMDCVPTATLGLSYVPRVKTGVFWTGDYGKKYTRVGTPAEQASAVRQAMRFVKEHPSLTPTNAILIYAWNEHDEGGFLCPTIKTDEAGKPVLKDDGTFALNDGVLCAVKEAITEEGK